MRPHLSQRVDDVIRLQREMLEPRTLILLQIRLDLALPKERGTPRLSWIAVYKTKMQTNGLHPQMLQPVASNLPAIRMELAAGQAGIEFSTAVKTPAVGRVSCKQDFHHVLG